MSLFADVAIVRLFVLGAFLRFGPLTVCSFNFGICRILLARERCTEKLLECFRQNSIKYKQRRTPHFERPLGNSFFREGMRDTLLFIPHFLEFLF